eukprot:SAG22_NODE_3141_length_1906_cov_18.510791_4_plen_91_part_00
MPSACLPACLPVCLPVRQAVFEVTHEHIAVLSSAWGQVLRCVLQLNSGNLKLLPEALVELGTCTADMLLQLLQAGWIAPPRKTLLCIALV